MRADVARFFVDLRRAVGAHQLQIAAELQTHADVIAALERCDLEQLPAWPEISRVVLGYTAWAGVDGRPVLGAIGIVLKDAEQRRQTAAQVARMRPAVAASSARLRHASLRIAEGARRLPREALIQARERPVRTFYALSLPLGIMLLMLNGGVLGKLYSHVPQPIIEVALSVKESVAVHFPPIREGLRWIEVEDPRSRRGDKLPADDR